MADLPDLSRRRAATDQNRLHFLYTDLELCFTFATLAKTEREAGEHQVAKRILRKAEASYATIARFVADVGNAEQKADIEQKLAELRARLDAEQQHTS